MKLEPLFFMFYFQLFIFIAEQGPKAGISCYVESLVFFFIIFFLCFFLANISMLFASP
jgi:hypothetical protein